MFSVSTYPTNSRSCNTYDQVSGYGPSQNHTVNSEDLKDRQPGVSLSRSAYWGKLDYSGNNGKAQVNDITFTPKELSPISGESNDNLDQENQSDASLGHIFSYISI